MLKTPTVAPVATRPAETPSWGTLLVLLTAIFITTLDFFIVNVSIPATQEDLGAGESAIQWVVAGFGLAVAAGLVIGGRLGDMYGRRRMFAVGLASFTVASAACGLAPDAATLIAARGFQGVSAALLMPQVLGILNTVYTGDRRTKAFTAYGVAMGFAGVFGQLIGGVLIEADLLGLGWRAVYWINVPVGIVTLALTPRFVPRFRSAASGRADIAGAVLVTAGLVAVMLPLVQGREQGWPLWTALSFAAAVPLLGGFAAHQRRSAARGGAPLVDPALFRERGFPVGVLIALVYGMINVSFFLTLALYLQPGRGLSALDSGLVFIAVGAGYFVSSSLAGRAAERLGNRVLTAGALLQAAGHAVLAATIAVVGVSGPVAVLIPGLAAVGFGMGWVMGPLPATVLASVTPHQAGSASGVLTTAQQAGGALGVAALGGVFYGVLGDSGYGAAFTDASLATLGLCLLAAVLVRGLPCDRRAG